MVHGTTVGAPAAGVLDVGQAQAAWGAAACSGRGGEVHYRLPGDAYRDYLLALLIAVADMRAAAWDCTGFGLYSVAMQVEAANPAAAYPAAALLDADECRALVARIDALREHWTERSAGRFYTLGTVAYLDAPDAASARAYGADYHEPDQYYRSLQRTNPVLAAHFSELHQRLAACLAELLGAPTAYAPDLALPGFHIFLDSPDFAVQANHVPHYDQQYRHLRWPNPEAIDFRRSLSYTMALELPAAGGGLKLWRLDYYEMIQLPKEEAKARIRGQSYDVVAYHPGRLVCHTGNELHQILPWRAAPGERRITLQGHGLLIDGVWQLYW